MQDFEGMKYWVSGDGQPILLLHGWGADHASFAAVARYLSAEYRVYALDLWGFGASREPDESATIFDYAEAVYRFVVSVIGCSAVILGHSFGGRIALILGSRPLIRALVLVDSAGLKPRLSLRQKASIRQYRRQRALVEQGRCDSSSLERFGSADYRSLDATMRGVFVRVVNEDLAKFAKGVNVPTLILWGKSDRTTPPRMARRLQRLISGARLTFLQGGHFCFLDSPREFCLQCSDFLENLER